VYPYDKGVFKLKSMPTPREKREMKPISKFILKLKESTLCLDEDRGLDEDRFGSVLLKLKNDSVNSPFSLGYKSTPPSIFFLGGYLFLIPTDEYRMSKLNLISGEVSRYYINDIGVALGNNALNPYRNIDKKTYMRNSEITFGN